MSNFQAQVRALFRAHTGTLTDTLHVLNRRVMDIAQGEKYITFFVAKLNTEGTTLDYVNCGHNPPLFLHPDGRHELLGLGSVGLGMFREIPSVEEGQIQVMAGSVLCCYTDGLVEQEDAAEVPFGTERLATLLKGHDGQALEGVHQQIVDALEAFRGDTPRLDDTAMLSCRFR